MGLYLKNSLFLACLAVVLLIASASARFSTKVTEDEISKICSQAKNPGFCLQFLKSDPETAKLDFPGLAKHTIDSAQTSASATLNQIQSLAKTATDPHLKEIYDSCSENYDNAIGSFQDALKSLAVGDPGSLSTQVSAALTNADTCIDDLKSASPDPSVVKKTDDLENVCSIILVISNLLPK